MKKVSLLIVVSILTLTSVLAETVTIDIDTALELLHKNNMNIQAKAFDVKIAERNKKNVWNAFLPTLGVTAGSAFMDNPGYTPSVDVTGYSLLPNPPAPSAGDPLIYLGSIPEPAGPDQARFGLNVSTSANLIINYALGAGIKNYKLLYEAGEISYEMAVKGLEMNTKIQFYSLLNLEEQLLIMKKGIDLAEKRYHQVQENYNNGLIPELDVLRTQVGYESQKPGYSNLRTQYNNMLSGFKVMLGIERNTDVKIDGSLDTETYTFDSDELISKYLGKSLSLKSLNKNLEVMENAKTMTALYAYTPTLALGYSLDILKYNPWASSDAFSFAGEDGLGFGTFTLGLSFSLDNYIPGSKKSVEISNMKDQIHQLRITLQESALQSEVEIINTIAKLENSVEQLEANKLNVELARKAYQMTSEAYQLGTKELLDVESAQNDLLSAEAKVLGEQFTYLSGLLNLEYTLNTSIEDILER